MSEGAQNNGQAKWFDDPILRAHAERLVDDPEVVARHEAFRRGDRTPPAERSLEDTLRLAEKEWTT